MILSSGSFPIGGQQAISPFQFFDRQERIPVDSAYDTVQVIGPEIFKLDNLNQPY